VGVGVRVAEIVDRDDLDLVRPTGFIQGAQHIAPDASVTVDAHLDRHVQPSA
jgi:hypothetical protein